MKVVIFGATGMLGHGALRECLLDDSVENVLTIGRTATGVQNAKLREIVQQDLFDLTPIESDFVGCDACFFCLGVSSVGISQLEYQRITYDLTISVARTLAEQNPAMTFIYISGQGTDSSERGRSMWARVKGRTENALLKLPFHTYMFRPGYVQPMHGAKSKTTLYNLLYVLISPLYPVLRRLMPTRVTTTEHIGRAMIEVAKMGYAKRVLETRDINEINLI